MLLFISSNAHGHIHTLSGTSAPAFGNCEGVSASAISDAHSAIDKGLNHKLSIGSDLSVQVNSALNRD